MSDAPPTPEDEWTSDETLRTRGDELLARRYALVAVDGVARGTSWQSSGQRASIGSHRSCDVSIDDPTVSRFHAEIRLGPDGARVRDLGSRNGTRVDGVRVGEAWLKNGSMLRLGRTALRFDLESAHVRVAVSTKRELGRLVGQSFAMRAVFAQLERAAASDATVLLDGETGTGKGEAAAAIHDLGARAAGPFVVVDCGALPRSLVASELFGHERGAFTGADRARAGAFELAHGGTLLLDEIGELPLDVQPLLLRVLEAREVRRVGATAARPIDVRVLAATHRDLRVEVSAERFREDLYYRLVVLHVQMPPLRERLDDLPLLVARIVEGLRLDPARSERLRDPAFVSALGRSAWRGNVRELRNYLARAAVLDDDAPPGAEGSSVGSTHASASVVIDPSLPYDEARRITLERFEQSYAEALVRLHGGNVSRAARAAGMGRTYLHRLLARHGVPRDE